MARSNRSKPIALGGIFAALAVVVMCMGGMIPVATFVCPMLCIILLAVVHKQCGDRIAWAWYGAVAILSALLGPDKEAAAIFVFMGYYPIIKPKMEKLPLKWLWKIGFFNVAIGIMYGLLIHLFGLEQIAREYAELGTIMTVVMLLMGNVTFILLDRLLTIRIGGRRK